jgi:chemotaxis protein CheX
MVMTDITASTEGETLALAASMDLTEAEGLYQALRQGLQHGGIVLDGSAVERVSTPCLQLLAAAAASAAANGVVFRLHGPSTVLLTAISQLGLGAAIPVEVEHA